MRWVDAARISTQATEVPEFVCGLTHAARNPFRGCTNAIRTELPEDTVTVLDAFPAPWRVELAQWLRAHLPLTVDLSNEP